MSDRGILRGRIKASSQPTLKARIPSARHTLVMAISRYQVPGLNVMKRSSYEFSFTGEPETVGKSMLFCGAIRRNHFRLPAER